MKIMTCIFCLLLTGSIQNLEEQQARIDKLENSLLAPCCYREPVSRHGSEIAQTIRNDIKRMVIEGKTDDQILEFYKSEYGYAILAEPEGMSRWMIYGTPVVMLAIGTLLVGCILWKWRSRSLLKSSVSTGLAAIVPEAYQEKINQELKAIDR